MPLHGRRLRRECLVHSTRVIRERPRTVDLGYRKQQSRLRRGTNVANRRDDYSTQEGAVRWNPPRKANRLRTSLRQQRDSTAAKRSRTTGAYLSQSAVGG